METGGSVAFVISQPPLPKKKQVPGSMRPRLQGKAGWTVTAAPHLTPSSGQCAHPTPNVTQEHCNSAHFKYLTVNIYINCIQFIEVKKRGNTIPEALPRALPENWHF